MRRLWRVPVKMKLAVALLCPSALCAATLPGATVSGAAITLRSDQVTVRYDRHTGAMDVLWKDGHKLLGVSSGATLANGRVLSTADYPDHMLESGSAASSAAARGVREYIVRSAGPGLPDFLQHIWLFPGQPRIDLEAELDSQASLIGTRHFDVVVLHGPGDAQIGSGDGLRMLQVPFDNDMWVRYKSTPVAQMQAGQTYSSSEVTTLFDNATRQALVLGSLVHTVWKTAIEAHADQGKLSGLDVYGGISSPSGVRTDTHDTVPHGIVRGPRVVSPRIFIASFSDWRNGLEAFGSAVAALHPPMVWEAGAPMGWNSWAAYGEHIDDDRYLGAAKFVHDVLVPQGFTRHKVVYINLDAFWSHLDAVQLASAVRTIRSMRSPDGTQLEPGIYWAPFAYFSSDGNAWVEGTGMKYRYRDILLKGPDGSVLPKVDGGWPIDPTNPGEKERIAFTIAEFEKLGFRYIKLDFLSHGALEGAHADPAVQTGVEAYNEGMSQIVNAIRGKMFISLSIAPLFPSGYGNSRRISCDTMGHISGAQSTEYMLNSLTYGWWTNRHLYLIDPDHVALGSAADHGARSITEGSSRLLSAIISGGMIVDSSPVADNEQARQFARAIYDNRNLFAVADQGQAFRPVEGDTGDRAANAFERPSPHGVYLALFNYDDQQPQTISVPVNRISPALASASSVEVIDAASGRQLAPAHGELSLTLQPAQSQLVEVRANP